MKRGPYFDWHHQRDDGRDELQAAIDWYKGGADEEQIARRLGIRPKAVKERLTRAGVYVGKRKHAVQREEVRFREDLASEETEATEDAVEEEVPLPADVRLLLKENARLRKSLYDAQAKDSLIVQAHEAAIVPIAPIDTLPWTPRHPHKRYRDHVAVAPVFDVQIGTCIHPSNVAGLSEFGYPEFQRRLARWTETVIHLTELHRNSYDVPVLEVPFGGDIVEGEQIFIGQPHHIDMGVYDQVYRGAHDFAWALHRLATEGGFREIRTRWIAGNHGRPSRKGENAPTSNWDYVFARAVEGFCRNMKQVQFLISQSSFMAYRIPEAREFIWLLSHGDNIKANFSIPYYGFDRAVRNMTLLTGLPIDYMLVGHHHRQAQIDSVRGQQIMLGNWVGGSGYAIDQLQTGGHAKSLLLMVHPEHGIVASHDIYLYRMRKMVEDERGMYTPTQDVFTCPPAAEAYL